MKSAFDGRLYLVTDSGLSLGRPLEEVVAAAIEGGVTAVQLREKDMPTGAFIALARRLKEVTGARRVPLIINDRADVALASEADGLHIGQSDMSVGDARRLLGRHILLGLSVETIEQARAAEGLDIDYLGVSPVFLTSTKTDTGKAWGLEGLRALRQASTHPLVAIGGINAMNARQVLEAGADGIAVVSAICSAPDPLAAARELSGIVEKAES